MRRFLPLLLFTIHLNSAAQRFTIRKFAVDQKEELAKFMSIVGFRSFGFEVKTRKDLIVNFYYEEFLNDSLISKFDVRSTKDQYPQELLPLIFQKTSRRQNTLRICTYSKNDTIESVFFRFGGVENVKNFQVSKNVFSYDWKEAFEETLMEEKIVGKKIPLLYYSTAEMENVGELKIQKFCNIPNVLNNLDLLKNKNKISHYFVVGVQFLDEL